MPVQSALLLFEGLRRVHLEKDVGMLPVYLKKCCGVDARVEYLRTAGEELPGEFRGVPLRAVREWKLPGKLRKIPLVLRLIALAKKTDLLAQFHLSPRSCLYASVYRFFHKKGGLYLKLDMGMKALEEVRTMPEGKERTRLAKLLRMCDIISVETRAVRDEIMPSLLGVDIREKLLYLPNGIDWDGVRKYVPIARLPSQKEKLAISVGGIGDEAKDHALLLDALGGIDMNGWKVAFIGPVNPAFQGNIDAFFARNPHLKDQVIFTGPVFDRGILYNYYDRASVFIFTSKWESSGMVLTEAMSFGDFILTTDTGASRDVTDNGKLGRIIPVGDNYRLKRELADIFAGKTDTAAVYEGVLERAYKSFRWETLVRELYRAILAKLG